MADEDEDDNDEASVDDEGDSAPGVALSSSSHSLAKRRLKWVRLTPDRAGWRLRTACVPLYHSAMILT